MDAFLWNWGHYVHWVTGLLRDSTGHYDLAFFTNAVMALVGWRSSCSFIKSLPD